MSRPPGLAAAGLAAISVRFGQAAASLESAGPEGRKARLAAEMYQTPIAPQQIPVTGSAGLLASGDQMGPMTGYYWSVRRIVTYGYSAGSVTVYRNAVATGFGANAAAIGEQLITFPQAGTYTFGRGEILLRPDDNMMLVAAGVTLAAGQGGITVYGDADCFPSWLLSSYLI